MITAICYIRKTGYNFNYFEYHGLGECHNRYSEETSTSLTFVGGGNLNTKYLPCSLVLTSRPLIGPLRGQMTVWKLTWKRERSRLIDLEMPRYGKFVR